MARAQRDNLVNVEMADLHTNRLVRAHELARTASALAGPVTQNK